MGNTRGGAQANKGKKVVIPDDVDDLNVLGSQSGSSDYAEILVAEKHITSSWEKKTARDKRFMQKAKKELGNRISVPAEELKEALQEMEGIYSKFILDYAASEDVIRGIWVQIQEERQAFQALLEDHLRASIEGADKMEKGQIKGMALAKKACEDFRTAIRSLQAPSNSK